MLACNDSGDPGIVPVGEVRLTVGRDSIYLGDTTSIKVVLIGLSGGPLSDPRHVRVTVSNNTASLSGNILRGDRAGEALIIATSEGVGDTARIKVLLRVTSLTIASQGPTTFPSSSGVVLSAVLRGAGSAPISGRLVTWASSDTSIARVNLFGVVAGGRPGTTSIIASSEGVLDTLAVTVTPRLASIVFMPIPPLVPHDTHRLAATGVDPFGTPVALGFVQYVSSNGRVFQASASGLITATGGGDATLFVTAQPEGIQATASVVSRIPPLTGALTAGSGFCALIASGESYCWGNLTSGQLGNPALNDFGGTVNPILTLAPPLTMLGTAISSHTCGLDAAGAGWCWGANDHRQLASLASGPCNAVPQGNCASGPLLIPGGLAFRDIGTGGLHTCAVTTAGEAWCWGDNSSGQLGRPGASTVNAMAAVATSLSFSSVDLGTAHSCALTIDSLAYCWGRNTSGQLGDSTSVLARSAPVAVSGGHRFIELASGIDHTCGLTANGTVYCWGANAAGQLGSSASGTCFQAGSNCDHSPRLAGIGYSMLRAGGNRTCAINTAQQLECWGQNIAPTGRAVDPGRLYLDADVGGEICGRRVDNRIYCSTSSVPPLTFALLIGQY